MLLANIHTGVKELLCCRQSNSPSGIGITKTRRQCVLESDGKIFPNFMDWPQTCGVNDCCAKLFGPWFSSRGQPFHIDLSTCSHIVAIFNIIRNNHPLGLIMCTKKIIERYLSAGILLSPQVNCSKNLVNCHVKCISFEMRSGPVQASNRKATFKHNQHLTGG